MAINFSIQVYKMTQDVFSVPCTFHPVFSQPDGQSYPARGIYDTRQLDVIAEDGSVYVDQQTIFDIRTAEFPILPQQRDRVDIPRDCNGVALGMFEIVSTDLNGGGEMTLVIRRFEPQAPIAGRREFKLNPG